MKGRFLGEGSNLAVAAFGAVGGGDAVEFVFEVLGEVLGVVEAHAIGDLGDGELAFFQQFGSASEADMADEFNWRFTREEQKPLIERTAAAVELGAELADGKIGVAYILFDMLEDASYEDSVGGFDLHCRRCCLYLALVGPSNGGCMRQNVSDAGEEQFEVKRFDDIVDGAGAEAVEFGAFARHGREQDHGDLGGPFVGRDLFTKFHSIHGGHRDVADDEVGMIGQSFSPAFPAVAGFDDRVEVAEVVFQIEPEIFVVFDDEDGGSSRRVRGGWIGVVVKGGAVDGAACDGGAIERAGWSRRFIGDDRCCAEGGEGQANGEAAALIDLAFQREPAVVHSYKFLSDGEADAASLVEDCLRDI